MQTSKKIPLAIPIAVTLLVCSALTASAQTYTTNGTNGTTNNTSGTSLTPNTTNTSNPSVIQNSNIPAGYTQQSDGTYYNSSTGMYYDPNTGSYSTNIPTSSASATPGVPNTGAGGNAGWTIAILILLAVLAIGGIAYSSRRT